MPALTFVCHIKTFPKMRLLVLLLPVFMLSCKNHTNHGVVYPPGGYDFSKNNPNKDAYCFPPAGKISRRDSFEEAHDDAYFFQLFEEPDISLEPAGKTLFRLAYRDRFDTYVINLKEDEIIIKAGEGRYWPELDLSLLTETEKIHYAILRMDYPIDEKTSFEKNPPPPPPPPYANLIEETTKRRRIWDSMKKMNPDLLKNEYYDYLLKKAAANTKDTFSYSTRKIKITSEQFIKFINLLNQSNYWKMNYYCLCTTAMDGYRYSLEANTGKKYNYVGFLGPCDGDTTKFHQACQELIQMAKVNDRIRLTYK
jgi:hypothetical protein